MNDRNHAAGSRHTVLVVDDEADHLALIAGALHRAGFDVVEASRGADALRLAAGRKPAAAVLDVIMGHLAEGFDLARALRRAFPGLPIVFLTGLDRVYDLGSEIGEDWLPGDRLLYKPVPPDAVVAAVEELVATATGTGSGGAP